MSAIARGQSQSPLKTAQAAIDRGDYKSAEEIYRRELTLEPKSPKLLTDLGIALQLQGRSSAAIHVFQQSLSQEYAPGTYAILAEERCRTRDLGGARPMLAKIFREERHDTRILAVIAPCYMDLDEPLESIDVYRTLLTDKSFPQDLALIQLTKSYLQSAQFFFGRLRVANNSSAYIQAIQKALEQDSADARGAFPLAAKASRFFHADLTFPQALQVWKEHPKDAALLYQMGVLSGEESMRQFQLCNDKYPNSPYLEQLRADMLANQGQENQATAIYESLMQRHPELTDLDYNLGMLYRKRQEWIKALALFQQQLRADPSDERAAARVSEALLELQQYKQLRTYLLPRVQTESPPLWARLDLATAEQKLGNPDAAIKQLVAAEKDDPSEKSIHYRLMRLYLLSGRTASAAAEEKLFESTSR